MLRRVGEGMPWYDREKSRERNTLVQSNECGIGRAARKPWPGRERERNTLLRVLCVMGASCWLTMTVRAPARVIGGVGR